MVYLEKKIEQLHDFFIRKGKLYLIGPLALNFQIQNSDDLKFSKQLHNWSFTTGL